MTIEFNDFIIFILLCSLVAASYWLGYQFSINKAIEGTFKVLEQEDIIRIVEVNGEIEVYSGNKFYDGDENG